MTAREALGQAKLRLSGFPTAALDSELILAHILGTNRARLLLHPETILSDAVAQNFSDAIGKRREGFCVAYLTGVKSFRNLEFKVTEDVLVPRPDTETLVEAALRIAHAAGGAPLRVLDLCTGSGAVALALLDEHPLLALTASDISGPALAVAKENYRTFFGETALPVRLCTFIQSDLFADITGRFDLIVSNPPYVPRAVLAALSAEVACEPRIALDGGEDGLDLIRVIIARAPDYLNAGGSLLLEASPRQMPVIAELYHKAGFCGVDYDRDLAGHVRVIRGMRPSSNLN